MSSVKLKAITIGGELPGIGEFQHHIAVPAHMTVLDVMTNYQYKAVRKSFQRFDSIEAAQKAVADWNKREGRS